MKCVCGYEVEKFIEIAVRCGDNTSIGHFFKVFSPLMIDGNGAGYTLAPNAAR